MTEQELRWFDNAKKAFFASDQAFLSGSPENECFEELCKAIDTAKTLRCSLMGEPAKTKDNAKAFIEFIHLEVPLPEDNGIQLELIHSRTAKPVIYGYGKLVYAIRCMSHENENLNVDESIDYHILIDWNTDGNEIWAWVSEKQVVVNGRLIWNRLRQILAKFLTHIENIYTFPETGCIGVSINPPAGSIQPKHEKSLKRLRK